MAPTNGNSTKTVVARKGLIQPVLPALPVLPKPRNAPAKVKEKRMGLNGDEPAPSAVAEIQTGTGSNKDGDSQESSTGETMQVPAEQVVENHGVDSSAPQAGDEGQDVSNRLTNLSFMVAVDDSDFGTMTTPIRMLDSSTASVVERLSSLSSEQATTGSDLIRESAQENSYTTNAEEPANENARGSDVAPEVVLGISKTEFTSLHSENNSADAYSTHDTPNGTTLSSVASGILLPVSANGIQSGNENGHAALEVAANGSATLVKPTNMSNGTGASTIGKGTTPTILDHISNLEHSREWCDCEFQVVSPSTQASPLIRHVHSLVLLRSERLRSMLYPMRAQSYVFFAITLFPARQINPNAFDAALRFLYADTVLSAERLLPSNTNMNRVNKIHALDYILSYMAAGLELGVEPVVDRSFDLLNRSVDWDLAELVVKEALSMRAVSATAPHPPIEVGLAVDAILQSVFTLFITRLDVKNFALDVAATPVEMPSRLAHFDLGRAPLNPALANMVFGSMPVSPGSPTSTSHMTVEPSLSPSSIASAILLNLDFNDLSMLARGLKKIHDEDGVQIIRQVVEERERRRLSIFANKFINNKQRLHHQSVWDVIGWREYLAGGSLNRERVGFLLDNNNKRGTYI